MRVKKALSVTILICSMITSLFAQEEMEEERIGFKKENLFTGGGISLGFSGNVFQIGASPVLGYSIAPWVDAGITLNYNYVSFRDPFINYPDDKLRRSTYGGGVFSRLFPVNVIFAHIQFEHNFIAEKYIPGNGDASEKIKVEANSLLVGAGYASGRYPKSGQPFFYISLLFDVLNNDFSPYTSSTGGIRPIIRAGVQVPLFQGNRRRGF